MDRLHRAIKNVHRLDDLAARGTALTQLPPLPKLLAVLVYLCVTLSFQKYALTGLLGMALWPILLYEIDDLSIVKTLRQCWAVVALLVLVGIANLFFDRAPVLTLGPVVLSGGAVTLLVLVVKGVLCFLAVYLLIATTGMERVCAALRQLHVPRVLVTTILLTYRYIVLLLQEGNRISTAYALRAPGEKGIHFRAWGSLLGQLLLRSVDRAQLVYESMMLRGYGWRDLPPSARGVAEGQGERTLPRPEASDKGHALSPTACGRSPLPEGAKKSGAFFFLATLIYCLIFRIVPIFELLGQLF